MMFVMVVCVLIWAANKAIDLAFRQDEVLQERSRMPIVPVIVNEIPELFQATLDVSLLRFGEMHRGGEVNWMIRRDLRNDNFTDLLQKVPPSMVHNTKKGDGQDGRG
mmetsp:Transcript_25731/g.52683  ORF Transcript_25731/g.52683 Transcript_25731/m.52683 type:complete len:107 (+) Transcript_25731:689-1009(+)